MAYIIYVIFQVMNGANEVNERRRIERKKEERKRSRAGSGAAMQDRSENQRKLQLELRSAKRREDFQIFRPVGFLKLDRKFIFPPVCSVSQTAHPTCEQTGSSSYRILLSHPTGRAHFADRSDHFFTHTRAIQVAILEMF